MSWVKDAITALESGETAQVRPRGGSMRGRIESGQLVTIAPIMPDAENVDDVVFIRWKGSRKSATMDFSLVTKLERSTVGLTGTMFWAS